MQNKQNALENIKKNMENYNFMSKTGYNEELTNGNVTKTVPKLSAEEREIVLVMDDKDRIWKCSCSSPTYINKLEKAGWKLNERPRSKLRGIKRPTSLCSVLACYAAELRGIKPYFGLKKIIIGMVQFVQDSMRRLPTPLRLGI